MDLDRLLRTYPRRRPTLPPRQQELFEREYVINRSGGSLVNRIALGLESWMHRQVARDGAGLPGDVLELGAGTLNHLPYEPEGPAYDAVEPFASLAGLGCRGRLRDHFTDLAAVPADRRYGRILSVAVLEHLEDLPLMIADCARRLAPGGVFQAAIPSEGGFLWGLAWRCSTGLAYRLRTGAAYGPVMRHEHLSNQWEIMALLRACFTQVQVRRFPAMGAHGSLYTCALASMPNLAVAERWIGRGP